MAELNALSLLSDPNLVSYWRMEGNSSDEIGANDGTDTTITYSSPNGKFTQGAGLNGTSSFIAIADHASLDITGALTIAAWVYPSDTTPNKFMSVVCKGNVDSPAAVVYALIVDSRKVRGIVSNGTTANNEISSEVMSNTAWHHIAMVYTPSTSLELYLDGVRVINQTSSINAATQSTADTVAIGRDGDASQSFFGTKIDDVAIFNRALNGAEILTLYQETTTTGAAFLLNFT